jgi:hypothetical protein
MRQPVSAIITTLLLLVFVQPVAGAEAPPGKGLVAVPLTLTCADGFTGTLVSIPGGPPGSGPGWFEDGSTRLARSVTLTLDGEVVFSKTYGRKAGLGPAIHCEGTLPEGIAVSSEVVIVD